MDYQDAQRQVDKWAQQFEKPYWPPLEQMARLTEEVGEVAREMNHLHGTKKKKPDEAIKNLGEELADVLFTVCCIANSHNINLQDEWALLMKEKQYGRDNSRFEKKNEQP